MHCGPIRHQISLEDTPGADLRLELVVHDIPHASLGTEDRSIQQVFRALVDDQQRTAGICHDVVGALDRDRNCLVLTQWGRARRASA